MLNGDFIFIIPAFNPDEKLISLVESIYLKDEAVKIIVINDGSEPNCFTIFKTLQEKYECFVLHHAVNLGKGRALKTAFNYFLNNFSGYSGVVTVDADGQHSMDDIFACAEKLVENPGSLILGARDFNKNVVPFKSKFGNKMTRTTFRFLCGVNLSDTQTGLRGIPATFVKTLMNVSGERFEFEMNMLIETKKENIDIIEVPISTIYLDDNKSTHFNPLLDSIKIYSVFFRFIFSALSSCIIDLVLFSLISSFITSFPPIYNILISTSVARIFSSLFNYSINKNSVFKSASNLSIVKYYILASMQMTISWLSVSALVLVSINAIFAKICVDLILFIISFQIQRNWVFTNESEMNKCR